MGCTGICTGPHVHFEVIANGVIDNPQRYFWANAPFCPARGISYPRTRVCRSRADSCTAGGDGASSFRREGARAAWRADGGDGGRGGSVILLVEPGMTTLGDFKRRRHIRASAGGRGMGRKAHGATLPTSSCVPPGTVVRSHPEGEWLGELLEAGTRLVVARGGRGGRATCTSRRQRTAPTHAEKGTPGYEGWIELELKLIADIGLVGAPNAGKSTLLAALTEARPEVGAYPFTTISPNLGVIALDDERTAVIADVPGLIEGAHEGRGLGHHFLRHVERTRVIVGVVDGAADPVGEWGAVAEELRLHDPELGERPMPLVVTKLDLPEARDRWPEIRDALAAAGPAPIGVSAHEVRPRRARRALDRALADAHEAEAARPAEEAMRVHRFDPLAEGWEVVAEGEDLRVRGRRVEIAAARTDFENAESRDRFWRLLERRHRRRAAPAWRRGRHDGAHRLGRARMGRRGLSGAALAPARSPSHRRTDTGCAEAGRDLGGTFDPPTSATSGWPRWRVTSSASTRSCSCRPGSRRTRPTVSSPARPIGC